MERDWSAVLEGDVSALESVNWLLSEALRWQEVTALLFEILDSIYTASSADERKGLAKAGIGRYLAPAFVFLTFPPSSVFD